MIDDRKLLIALSPRLLREVPVELGFRGKTLQFLEQSVPHWVTSMGAMVAMVPSLEADCPNRPARVTAADYAASMDGLILQGGSDVDPAFYGETITYARGRIDAERDRFEMDLLQAFATAGKPVFGICRGMQLINIALGGTLFQDLHQDGATTLDAHHVLDLYDEHIHEVRIVPDSWTSAIYGGVRGGRHLNTLEVHGVVGDIVGFHRLKRARAHMQRDAGPRNAAGFQPPQRGLVKMQRGGGGRHRAGMFGKHRLVALFVVC